MYSFGREALISVCDRHVKSVIGMAVSYRSQVILTGENAGSHQESLYDNGQ